MAEISEKNEQTTSLSQSTLPTVPTTTLDSYFFTKLVHEQMMVHDKNLEKRNASRTTETTSASSRATHFRKFEWKEIYVNFNNVLLGPAWNSFVNFFYFVTLRQLAKSIFLLLLFNCG